METILTAYKPVQSITCLDTLQAHFKKALEPAIFTELHRLYLDRFERWYRTYELPTYESVDKILFVYETRPHENFPFLLYSLLYFAQGWGLYIVCKQSNYASVKDILGANAGAAHIHILPDLCGEHEDERHAYNAFMKSAAFWNSFPQTKRWILTAEVDSYLRKSIPTDIFQYAFCASIWPLDDEQLHVKLMKKREI